MSAMRDHDRRVVETYEKAARFYDLWGLLFERKVKRRCVEIASARPRERILDVGVGTGDLFVDLLAAHPEAQLTGIDLSPAMLAQARRKLARNGAGRWELAEGDARELPFATGSFDLVVSTYVMELLPRGDYPVVVGELVRVLRAGGELLLAGVVERPELIYRPARFMCRRHPAWQGGLDVGAVASALEQAGALVLEVCFIAEKGIPACLVHATAGLMPSERERR